MATEHSLLRGAIDSTAEASRMLSRYDRRDFNFKFTLDDLHTLKNIAVMSAQAAKDASELYGYVSGILLCERQKS